MREEEECTEDVWYPGWLNTIFQRQNNKSVLHHLSSASLLFHSWSFFIPPFHIKLLHFVKNNSPPHQFQSYTLFVCSTFHIFSPHPHRDLVSSLHLCLLLSHTYRGAIHAVSLSHLQFALNTRQSPASFYFSVSSWQQHHIIRLNPQANMPPHLYRQRRMRVSIALQTQFLQSVLFQLVLNFYTCKHTVAHAVFLC